MIRKIITTTLILTAIETVFMGCSEDKSTNPKSNQNEVNLDDAKLYDFSLLSIAPVSINITQPTIIDNEETAYGEIDIVVPNTVSLNGITSSITTAELNLSKFDILPGNSTTLNYQTQSHVHTIVNVLDKSKELLHYTVNIEHEVIPTQSTLTLTDFKFEASKNSQLHDDITIERRTDNLNRQDIYLFVPKGTNFSDLTPTATFDAEEVLYTQDSSIPIVDVNTPYPTAETSFDFAYPKSFIIVLRDGANNRIRWVNVFVDVKTPFKIEDMDITTPDVITPGSSVYFTGMTTCKNTGNHKLRFQSTTTYEDKVPSSAANFITADMNFATDGLAPNESADINVQVNGNLPVGQYKSTAVFHTKFVDQDNIDDLVNPIKMNITANVKN
ncbi:MAG: hypothetical protein ABJO02_04560 [Reichenbachiella sp.]|uniref:hypothetical protein n=1 Tax=Reichenbachiella sp. TaxID=2184521 RepID=UPI003296CD69